MRLKIRRTAKRASRRQLQSKMHLKVRNRYKGVVLCKRVSELAKKKRECCKTDFKSKIIHPLPYSGVISTRPSAQGTPSHNHPKPPTHPLPKRPGKLMS